MSDTKHFGVFVNKTPWTMFVRIEPGTQDRAAAVDALAKQLLSDDDARVREAARQALLSLGVRLQEHPGVVGYALDGVCCGAVTSHQGGGGGAGPTAELQ